MAQKTARPISRSRRATDTRAAILAAAARIFAQSGLDGARTDAIAAAAGVNKAMLYYYFKSKDLLYLAVLENYFKEFHSRAKEVLLAKGTAGAVLLRFVETHFDYISSQPDYPMLFQRLMLTSSERIKRLVRKYFAPLAQELFKVVERGKREGDFRPVDSHHAAISLVALNVFYFSSAPILRIVVHIDPYSAASLKHRKREVLEFVRHALFRNPEAPVL